MKRVILASALLAFVASVAWAECREGTSPITVTGVLSVTMDGSDYRLIGTDYSLHESSIDDTWAIYPDGPFFGDKTAVTPGVDGIVDARLSGFIDRTVRVTGCAEKADGFWSIDNISAVEAGTSK